MEAAAVAQAAEARNVSFAAVKAISDASDFELPPMEKFITATGQFRTSQFAFFLALRPWLWATAMRMARNSNKAAKALHARLNQMIESQTNHRGPAQQTAPVETRQ